MSNRILASELLLPYALVCAVDNSCSGLSTHPGGAMQEYLEHKKTIAGVTNAVVSMLATVSRKDIAGIWVASFSRCQRYRCRQVELESLLRGESQEEGAGAEPEPESEPEAA